MRASPQWQEPVASPSVGGPGGIEQAMWTFGGGAGWVPGWRWVAPPGIGDAPQHIFTTFGTSVFAVDGPGDRPVSERRIFEAPVLANYAVRRDGFPVAGGTFQATGLSPSQPVVNPLNEIYPRGIGALGAL